MFSTGQELSSGAQAAVSQRGNPSTLNLDDIFGDVMFTPDGDTVFLSEEQEAMASGEKELTTMASKTSDGEKFVPVSRGGGLYTTQLHEREKPALTMGTAADDVQATASVPYKKAPHERHHVQYATKKSSSRSGDRKMSEQQKVERR
jgi:hypothetical protein